MATMGRHSPHWMPPETRPVILAAIPVAFVAVMAGIVSYIHIVALCLRTHQASASYLYPFGVDFLIVAGSVILFAGYSLGWLCVVAGIAATLFANLEFGLPYGWLTAIVSTWPAVAFTVAMYVLERWLRTRRAPAPDTTAPEPVPDVPEAVPAAHSNGTRAYPAEARPFADELARGKVPGIKRIRLEHHVGQPKAQEIQGKLKVLAAANGHAPEGGGDGHPAN